jgi:PIN domain nuclease of toxin-antitoxin system
LILLDTHIWIWLSATPEKLPRSLWVKLSERDKEFGVSALTIWEALLVFQKGRLYSPLPPVETIRKLLSESGVSVIPADGEISILAQSLEFRHNDPADRFIAATAYHLGCPLATVDQYLLALPWLRTL